MIFMAGSLALLISLFLLAAAVGCRVLAVAGLKVEQPLDNLVFAAGIGFSTLQLLAGVVSLSAGLTAASASAVLLIMAATAWMAWKS